MTLDGIDITNLVWIDEFQFNQVEQEQTRGINGGLIVQGAVKHYGRPITLSKSWLQRSVVEQLVAKELGNPEMSLILDDGREFAVIFNRTRGPAVAATPVFDITNAPADWRYEVTLRLTTIEPTTP